MTRRCGSLTNRSIVTCICLRGKYLTPPCSTACEASVRSDGRAERSVRTVAAKSGTWSSSVSDRPRQIPGRWPVTEGDLVFGARPSAVATLVDRATRYAMVVALPTATRPTRWPRALIDHMGRLPAHLRRSLTWDRGSEMASIRLSPRRWHYRCSSAIRTTHGSAAPTRTRTDCCASTCTGTPIWPRSPKTSSTPLPRNSTTARVEYLAGPLRPKRSALPSQDRCWFRLPSRCGFSAAIMAQWPLADFPRSTSPTCNAGAWARFPSTFATRSASNATSRQDI